MDRHNAQVMSPEYEGLTEVFIADEAQAEIDELVDMLKEHHISEQWQAQDLYERSSKLIAKHKGE